MYLIDEIATRKNFLNWSDFKVRHKERLLILFFIILMDCLIEKLYTLPDSGFRCFRS